MSPRAVANPTAGHQTLLDGQLADQTFAVEMDEGSQDVGEDEELEKTQGEEERSEADEAGDVWQAFLDIGGPERIDEAIDPPCIHTQCGVQARCLDLSSTGKGKARGGHGAGRPGRASAAVTMPRSRPIASNLGPSLRLPISFGQMPVSGMSQGANSCSSSAPSSAMQRPAPEPQLLLQHAASAAGLGTSGRRMLWRSQAPEAITAEIGVDFDASVGSRARPAVASADTPVVAGARAVALTTASVEPADAAERIEDRLEGSTSEPLYGRPARLPLWRQHLGSRHSEVAAAPRDLKAPSGREAAALPGQRNLREPGSSALADGSSGARLPEQVEAESAVATWRCVFRPRVAVRAAPDATARLLRSWPFGGKEEAIGPLVAGEWLPLRAGGFARAWDERHGQLLELAVAHADAGGEELRAPRRAARMRPGERASRAIC